MFRWCLEVSAAWSPPSRGLGISMEADLAAKAMAIVETGLLAVLAMLTVWRRFFADHQMSQGGFLVDRDAMVWLHAENLRRECIAACKKWVEAGDVAAARKRAKSKLQLSSLPGDDAATR